jgi:hypothetical protein
MNSAHLFGTNNNMFLGNMPGPRSTRFDASRGDVDSKRRLPPLPRDIDTYCGIQKAASRRLDRQSIQDFRVCFSDVNRFEYP